MNYSYNNKLDYNKYTDSERAECKNICIHIYSHVSRFFRSFIHSYLAYADTVASILGSRTYCMYIIDIFRFQLLHTCRIIYIWML